MSNLRQPDVVTVAVSRVDGGLTILRVVTAEYGPGPNGTRVVNWSIDPTPAYIDSLIARYVNAGAPLREQCWRGGQLPVSWRFVPNDYVDETTDKMFRDAWKDAPGRSKPDVDMPKARNIHRERLRDLRAPLLDELDTAYLKADEENDQAKKREIVLRKKALRDITIHPDIDAATTPEELKVAALGVLNG